MKIILLLILWDNNERDDNIYDGDFKIVHFIEKDDSSETSSQVWNLFQF